MSTVVEFKNDIKVSVNLTVSDEPVGRVAFFDIFDANDKLEDFVRQLAAGEITDPVRAANTVMETIGFA